MGRNTWQQDGTLNNFTKSLEIEDTTIKLTQEPCLHAIHHEQKVWNMRAGTTVDVLAHIGRFGVWQDFRHICKIKIACPVSVIQDMDKQFAATKTIIVPRVSVWEVSHKANWDKAGHIIPQTGGNLPNWTKTYRTVPSCVSWLTALRSISSTIRSISSTI